MFPEPPMFPAPAHPIFVFALINREFHGSAVAFLAAYRELFGTEPESLHRIPKEHLKLLGQYQPPEHGVQLELV